MAYWRASLRTLCITAQVHTRPKIFYDEVMLTDMSSNSCHQGTHTNKKFEQIGELSVTRLYCFYILVTFCNKATELDSMKPNNKVIIKQEKKAEMANIYYVL